jgi:RND family efflux transporter MFP subunit
MELAAVKEAAKMRKRAVLSLVASLAIVGASCSNSSDASGPIPAAASGSASSAAAPVATQPAAASKATEPEILSVLSVEHQVDVAAQREGAVVSVTKDEGALVKVGDILGQLDDRTLQMEIVKAGDDLQVAQNNVKYKEAELKAKTAAYRRQQQLRSYGISSDADLEAAEFAAKAAEFDMHGWQALVESSQAEIHKLEIELDQTRVRAPFSGAVVRRYVREGQTVAKGDKCFRVSQLSPLLVQFQVPESAARRPERGAPVSVSLVDQPKREYTAEVVKISPTIDPASDSYNVTARLTGAGTSDLRPGMAVRVAWTASVKPKS